MAAFPPERLYTLEAEAPPASIRVRRRGFLCAGSDCGFDAASERCAAGHRADLRHRPCLRRPYCRRQRRNYGTETPARWEEGEEIEAAADRQALEQRYFC